MSLHHRPSAPAPRLRWTGILFALAANLFLVTAAHLFVGRLFGPGALAPELLATAAAPVLAGAATALYVESRGAMHAFIGGMASAVLLGLLVFAGVWQMAIFAGAFCTLGGALTEILLRRRRQSR
jgi:hypothetical protein